MQVRVSLSELDRWFQHLLDGKPYHGEAINPKNLSVFERLMGVGKVCLLQLSHSNMISPAPHPVQFLL